MQHDNLCRSLEALRLFYARRFPHIYGKEYNPDEPRIPAGEEGAGEWTVGLDTDSDDDSSDDDTFDDDDSFQLAAGDGMPGDHERANGQVRDIAVQLGLTQDQQRQLHEDISGEDMGYQEVLQRARNMFDK